MIYSSKHRVLNAAPRKDWGKCNKFAPNVPIVCQLPKEPRLFSSSFRRSAAIDN